MIGNYRFYADFLCVSSDNILHFSDISDYFYSRVTFITFIIYYYN